MTASCKRLEYAKVCMEIDVNSDIPYNVKVVMWDGSLAHIKAVVPWYPQKCKHCLCMVRNWLWINKNCVLFIQVRIEIACNKSTSVQQRIHTTPNTHAQHIVYVQTNKLCNKLQPSSLKNVQTNKSYTSI